MASGSSGIMRRFSPHSRAASLLLTAALLAGVLAATIGAGYSASRPELDTPGAYLAKLESIVYVNGVSGDVEAEAIALAQGDHPTEIVTLADGRVAVVDTRTNQVWVLDPGMMAPQGPPVDHPDPAPKPAEEPKDAKDAKDAKDIVLVPAPDSGYVGSGDVVTRIDEQGRPSNPVRLPGKIVGDGVPDAVEGIWVRTENGDVAHVVKDEVRRLVRGRSIEALTVAEGQPIAVTETGELLRVAERPLRRIDTEPVPHGDGVLLGSAKGPGRWVLVLDTEERVLVAVDPRTGAQREFADLPAEDSGKLGQPVQAGNRAYVPDYGRHLLYVRDLRTGRSLDDIEVPGDSPTFSLEVRSGQVWANDQFDRGAVTVDKDGHETITDKGDAPGLSDTHGLGDADDQDEPTESPDPDQPTQSEPPPSPGPSDTEPAPMVEVPAIEPGTELDEACERIRAADLTCAPVGVGTDGRANTVATDPVEPPAGTRVPKSSRVIVRHYGPTAVPDVVGQHSDAACGLIEGAKLACVRMPREDTAPIPQDLDVVKEQTPGNGAEASTGDEVVVSYHDKALLADYSGQGSTTVCGALEETYRTVQCQVVEGASEQVTGKPAGVVYEQQPPPGAVVRSTELVTLTVVKGSPYRVPNVVGMRPEAACAAVAPLACDPRADLVHRDYLVHAQEPAAGTPMDGGAVVVHYPTYPAVVLSLYRADNGDPVFLLRQKGFPGDRYNQWVADLGWGYADQTLQPGAIHKLYDHFCANNNAANKCLGYEYNHYVSGKDGIYHPDWKVQGAPSVLDCQPGMVPIYRGMNRPGGVTGPIHKYRVITEAELPAWEWHEELLGCLWPL